MKPNIAGGVAVQCGVAHVWMDGYEGCIIELISSFVIRGFVAMWENPINFPIFPAIASPCPSVCGLCI